MRKAVSVPSDRSGGLVSLRAAWPPRAAEGSDGDSGRILRDEMPKAGSLKEAISFV